VTEQPQLTAAMVLEDMTPDERERAELVESLLPALRDQAAEADRLGTFLPETAKLIAESGLLGLVVPKEYGGLGGTLRDLTATTYALGTACPSTALAYFFHCSSSSRGMLPLGAIDAGYYTDEEIPVVRAFAEKVLTYMGAERKWIGNFASESVKAETANVVIQTEARKVDGGWLVSGTKSFGCLANTADFYLVTAKLEGVDGLDGLALFLVNRTGDGVSPRPHWNGLGMRSSDNDGCILKDAFVADDHALSLVGGFQRATKVARGTWVGNQIAIASIYAGIARHAYEFALDATMTQKFGDTGASIASSPMHQVLIGETEAKLEDAHIWLRRQLLLETSEPPLQPNSYTARQWRLSKGQICERAFEVCTNALKMCGTSRALMDNVIGQCLRDSAMGLVQAFPAERGKLDVAKQVTTGTGWAGMTTLAKKENA
jgi:alkylation response protein AidB-like acyl-CoA dehydrogenase